MSDGTPKLVESEVLDPGTMIDEDFLGKLGDLVMKLGVGNTRYGGEWSEKIGLSEEQLNTVMHIGAHIFRLERSRHEEIDVDAFSAALLLGFEMGSLVQADRYES